MGSYVLTDHSSLITRHYIVGIDEAGRGPIAGPVAVGAVAFLKPFDIALFEGVKDSKKLSEKKRDHFASVVEQCVKNEVMSYSVQFSSSNMIDEKGIVFAIRSALSSALNELSLNPVECNVLLDGSLYAPKEFLYQKTIIKGDETELPITLAGIMAKTTRDRYMKALASDYPLYGFDKHKGYGTNYHYQAIKERGMCPQHRSSFIDLTK